MESRLIQDICFRENNEWLWHSYLEYGKFLISFQNVVQF